MYYMSLHYLTPLQFLDSISPSLSMFTLSSIHTSIKYLNVVLYKYG